MVYIDNLDGYEEVYDEFEETPATTEFIYYDAGKLLSLSYILEILMLKSCNFSNGDKWTWETSKIKSLCLS